MKAVKKGLVAMEKAERCLPIEEWDLIACEITSLLNSRLLANPNKDNEVLPITAKWILHLYRDYSEEHDTVDLIEDAQENTKRFWEEWMKSVPRELFKYPKWEDDVPNPNVGDRVLIIKSGFGNTKTDRKYWKKGTVVRCIESKDKVVRRVVVQLADGRKERHVVQNLVVNSVLNDKDEETTGMTSNKQ